MGIQWCGNADGDEINFSNTTEVGCGLEHSILNKHGKVAIYDITNIVVT